MKTILAIFLAPIIMIIAIPILIGMFFIGFDEFPTKEIGYRAE